MKSSGVCCFGPCTFARDDRCRETMTIPSKGRDKGVLVDSANPCSEEWLGIHKQTENEVSASDPSDEISQRIEWVE